MTGSIQTELNFLNNRELFSKHYLQHLLPKTDGWEEVDEGGETARCWRHNRTGGKLYWFAVLDAVVSCGDPAPTGKEFVEQVWKPAAKEFLGVES